MISYVFLLPGPHLILPIMWMLQHRPAPPLATYVAQFWYRCGEVSDAAPMRALPTGSADLIFDLLDERPRVIVHGAQSRYFIIDARPRVHVVGVHFRPGGAGALLGVPAHELTDLHLSLDELWGSHADTMRTRLLEAPTPLEKFRVLEREFLDRLRRSTLVHPAVSFALRGIQSAPTPMSIAALQDATGYSARRFTTLFTQTVGMTPKLYSRIQRLCRVVEQLTTPEEPDWAVIASEHGYYDQPHLIRDFREFSGVTPAQYRPLPGVSPLHMRVDE